MIAVLPGYAERGEPLAVAEPEVGERLSAIEVPHEDVDVDAPVDEVLGRADLMDRAGPRRAVRRRPDDLQVGLGETAEFRRLLLVGGVEGRSVRDRGDDVVESIRGGRGRAQHRSQRASETDPPPGAEPRAISRQTADSPPSWRLGSARYGQSSTRRGAARVEGSGGDIGLTHPPFGHSFRMTCPSYSPCTAGGGPQSQPFWPQGVSKDQRPPS